MKLTEQSYSVKKSSKWCFMLFLIIMVSDMRHTGFDLHVGRMNMQESVHSKLKGQFFVVCFLCRRSSM